MKFTEIVLTMNMDDEEAICPHCDAVVVTMVGTFKPWELPEATKPLQVSVQLKPCGHWVGPGGVTMMTVGEMSEPTPLEES